MIVNIRTVFVKTSVIQTKNATLAIRPRDEVGGPG